MPRPSFASVIDLEAFTGETIGNVSAADSLLARASELVRAYANTTWLNDAGTAVEGLPEQIVGEVCDMVDRATRNPAGITQEQAGPFSRSFGSEAAQRLYLAKSNKMVIRAAVGAARSGIGTLSTSRGPLET